MTSETKDPHDKLVRQICDGAISWLRFSQTVGLSGALTETATYMPIFQIAASKDWFVYPQFPLPRMTIRRGAPQTLDFLVRDKEDQSCVAGIEFKLIKTLTKYNQDIPYDLGKLAKTGEGPIYWGEDEIAGQNYKGYFLICARGYSVFNYFKKKYDNEKYRKLFEQMKKVWGAKENSDYSIDHELGWVRKGLGSTASRFSMLALKQQDFWMEYYRSKRGI
jgi:hypothetical protein